MQRSPAKSLQRKTQSPRSDLLGADLFRLNGELIRITNPQFSLNGLNLSQKPK
ncbi:hypothetical protein M595_5689 [Lyngbya aestuarii BL J]|uniref:Uncharacterized protein n=1 Tax=Lyngbya aestuarii BL J TaxID=1348334 RepID=U7Q9B6_9CYAN|nr:hypothetical protein M595_5689 [Lyngbya aestuarii BL J]